MKSNAFQIRLIKPVGAGFTETLFHNMIFEKCVKTACYVETLLKDWFDC